MPCNSDHLIPTEAEKHHVKAVDLLFFAYSVNSEVIPEWLKVCLRDKSYGEYHRYKDLPMRELCSYLRQLKKKDEQKFNDLVYGRSKQSRRLADWWEDHCKIDEQRKKAEKKEIKLSKISKECLEEFDKLAGENGYQRSEGSGPYVLEVDKKYEAAKEKLKKRILYLEKQLNEAKNKLKTN